MDLKHKKGHCLNQEAVAKFKGGDPSQRADVNRQGGKRKDLTALEA
jgi:hypothetical protein